MPAHLAIVGVNPDDDVDAAAARAQAAAESLAFADGILLLADVFGATPCNIGAGCCRTTAW